jgi:Asp-tRNA(Asn)/Glu-tRNA(Gln) amidotransferase A subunit family amidase
MKKETDKSYLYIGQLTDVHGRELGINDKKIGITTQHDHRVREMQLSKTKMPISVAIVKLYEFVGNKTAELIEKGIFHNLLVDRNTSGEWFDDDDDDCITKVHKAIQTLINLGLEIREIDLLQDTKASKAEKNAISKAKAVSNQIYLDLSKIDKATNEDDNYSLWLLTTIDGETYSQIYNLNTTRAAGKKATPETVINYCNANSFLEKVDFDRTKITAKFIISSNDKEEINNKKRELKL